MNLSDLIQDESKSTYSKEVEITNYTDEKEELEMLLLSGNLSISKNEKITKYFI